MNRRISNKYKKTEIGVIPGDWEAKKLGINGSFFSGGTPNTSIKEYYKGEIPFITSSDLNQGKIRKVSVYISKKGLKYSSAKLIKDGQLLIALYGATAGVVAISEIKGAINQAVLAIQSDVFNKYYLYYFFQENKQKIIEIYTQGGQPNLSAFILKQILIPFPPLPEQRAIAQVLSDMDNLIDSIGKLIEKKKLIKKGAMQELLTGRKRLPGFKGEWVRKKLREITEIQKGKQLSKIDMNSSGIYPVYNGGISKSGFTNKFNTERNVVTISEGGNSCGYVNFIKERFWCSGHCYKLLNIRTDKEFLYHLLKFNEYYIQSLRVGSGLPNIQRKEIENYKLYLPSDINEQRAIAQVLSDMDAEIETLEKKKQKYEQIKKGAMQLLLTGRVRLKNYNTNEVLK